MLSQDYQFPLVTSIHSLIFLQQSTNANHSLVFYLFLCYLFFLYPLRCSHIKNNVHHFLLLFFPSFPLKSLSCLGSRPSSIFWNRKKFVLPFPHFYSKLYRIFMVLDIKNFVQNSCISPVFLLLLFFSSCLFSCFSSSIFSCSFLP